MGKYRKRFNENARSGFISKRENLKSTRVHRSWKDQEHDDQEERDNKRQNITTTINNINNNNNNNTSQEHSDNLQFTSNLKNNSFYSDNNNNDTNYSIIDNTKNQNLKNSTCNYQSKSLQNDSKISSKKRKRLDKYIERQLRREERDNLLEKLSKTKTDISILHPSKILGNSQSYINNLNFQNHKQPLELESENQNYHSDSDSESISTEGLNLDLNLSSNSNSNSTTPSIWPTVKRKPVPKKNAYTWRVKLEREKLRKAKKLDQFEDDLHQEYLNQDNSDSFQSDDNDNDNELSDPEEWNGFSDDSPTDNNSDSESESDSDSDSTLDNPNISKKRGKDFKAWAEEQMNKLVDIQVASQSIPKKSKEIKSQSIPQSKNNIQLSSVSDPHQDFVPPPLLEFGSTVKESDINKKSAYVIVDRDPQIQTARLSLPILSEEQRIIEAVRHNDCIVICGETGSGKTTQVPQFLFEAGYGFVKNGSNSSYSGMIGITQPRRVAAISMANRVSSELGSNFKDTVAYQVRFDSSVSSNTCIKFMTDGVLLREISNDFLLSKYSCIIVDEAHERNINTDILIGVLSRIIKLRRQMTESKINPLKLIIMSATLRVKDFTQNPTLFKIPPPVLKVDARQYPVSIHFNRKTKPDFIQEAFSKVTKIHQRLPPGGILVFLTGQNDIVTLAKRLNAFSKSLTKSSASTKSNLTNPLLESEILNVSISGTDAQLEVEDIDLGGDFTAKENFDYDENEDEDDDNVKLEDDLKEDQMIYSRDNKLNSSLHVLPLYSLLPTKEQLKVFKSPPDGTRLCVLATNIAETSLTIPGIRYVVDCGRSKEANYDKETGVRSYDVGWISKASADQRSGRAGRTGPGHCYRLYSSAVYESEFPQFGSPEILRMPIESIVLQMKCMGIDVIANFPFPTPPDRIALQKAEKLLSYLGALDEKNNLSLTDLGRSMSVLPLSPRFARMIIVGKQFECLPYIIAIVAALTVGNIFLTEADLGILPSSFQSEQIEDDGIDKIEKKTNQALEEERKEKRRKYYNMTRLFSKLDPNSDALKSLCAVCAYDYAKNKAEFCSNNFLRLKSLQEISKLRKQIIHITAIHSPGSINPRDDLKLPPPSKIQSKALNQMVAAGFIDQVALRSDLAPPGAVAFLNNIIQNRHSKRTIDIPYLSLFPSSFQSVSRYQDPDEAMQQAINDRAVYIHPNSIISQNNNPPDYIIYSVVQRSHGSGKLRIIPLTAISGSELANIAKGTSLISYSKPIGGSTSLKLITLPDGSIERESWVIPRLGANIGKGDLGWDLPPVKVIDKKFGKK